MPNSVTNSGPCQTWLLRNRNKYWTDTMHTYKHTKRFSHMKDPATCPLYGGSDKAPHMLLRCNNQTLKRMHINWHHAVAVVVKRSAKASWAQQLSPWMLVTRNYEKLCDAPSRLILNPLMTFRNIPTGFSQHSKTFPRHQSRPDGVLIMPIEGRGRYLDPKQISPRDRDIHLEELIFCSDITPQRTLEKVHN
jgi:hypothetical protein